MTKPCKRPFRWPKRRKFEVRYTRPSLFMKDDVFGQIHWAETMREVEKKISSDRFWWSTKGYSYSIKQVTL